MEGEGLAYSQQEIYQKILRIDASLDANEKTRFLSNPCFKEVMLSEDGDNECVASTTIGDQDELTSLIQGKTLHDKLINRASPCKNKEDDNKYIHKKSSLQKENTFVSNLFLFSYAVLLLLVTLLIVKGSLNTDGSIYVVPGMPVNVFQNETIDGSANTLQKQDFSTQRLKKPTVQMASYDYFDMTVDDETGVGVTP